MNMKYALIQTTSDRPPNHAIITLHGGWHSLRTAACKAIFGVEPEQLGYKEKIEWHSSCDALFSQGRLTDDNDQVWLTWAELDLFQC